MSDNIYVGNDLRLTLTCGVDMTGATTKTFEFERPDDTTDELASEFSDAATGKAYINIKFTGDNAVAGKWKFWEFFITAAGKDYHGDVFELDIYEPGTVV